MKVSNHSAVPVYTISGSSTARPLPEWLARKRKRSLKSDPEYANRIELLQDFEFEEASQCIRASDDGQWVMSTGTYKPQIHTHYLPHLSLSFARHTSALNTTFILLSQDYSKSLHLQSDRSLEFHTPAGCHYITRLPRYGRDLQYDTKSAEALVPSVGVNQNGMGEVFRLNLEAGRYMRSYEIDIGGASQGAVNVASVATDSHNLLAFGTSLGTIEFWDPRSHSQVSRLKCGQEVTALQFASTGLGLATGSSDGLIHLYDLRSPLPLLKKDQGYGYPIHTLTYLESTNKILSSDKRIIKIWNTEDGKPWTSVEPAVDINAVTWCKGSGMLLTANEGRQQHSFLIPQLGPAPRWCSFLDNLVEEMSEDPNDPNAFSAQTGQVYDNYKFLTTLQLESLNLSHLIGTTSLLRPYMHGYFVSQRLYEEAKLIADPFIWEEQLNKKVRQKIEAERESRIRGNKKVTAKVNRRLAEKMLDRQEHEERRQARKVLDANKKSSNLLADDRFAQLFQDEDFAIDETSREFQSLNPSTKPLDDKTQRTLTAVEEEIALSLPSSEDDSEEEAIPTPKNDRLSSASYKKSGHQPQMKISSSHKPQRRDQSFGSRAQHSTPVAIKQGVVGEREISFVPKPKSSKPQSEAQGPRRQDKGRRSASGNILRSM